MSEPILEVVGLSKAFGGLRAVSDLSFRVNRGEIVAIIGPNGAGKTTTFNLITGFIRPDTGRIRFRGDDIVGLSPHDICLRGMVRTFQLVKPFRRLSILENVAIGALLRHVDPKQAMKRAEEICARLNLPMDVPLSGLTIAMLKRLEMARALATEPAMILLDEIMAGLNPRETAEIVSVVQQINESGVTVLLIEHVMQAVMSLSHRVIVLDFGKKIAEGKYGDIVQDSRVVNAYLGGARDA